MEVSISIPHEELALFCRRHGIQRMELFGSALREDFGPESDVDLLITFEEGVSPKLRDLMAMEEELKSILGRKVDFVERRVVEESENYIRRKHILRTAQPIYERR